MFSCPFPVPYPSDPINEEDYQTKGVFKGFMKYLLKFKNLGSTKFQMDEIVVVMTYKQPSNPDEGYDGLIN
jgi:hypothetical protein